MALAAAVLMPLLARAKIRLAGDLDSPALRADGINTLFCGLMSLVLLLGPVANVFLKWWWLDAAAALLLVPLLIKEGLMAMRAARQA